MNDNSTNEELFGIEQQPENNKVDLKQVNYKGQD
jgi:hypothetical protein